MTIKAILNAKDFLYVARFASTEDPRYYLNGVQIEPQGDHVALAATDGHALGALKLGRDEARGEGTPFILTSGRDFIRACKGKKSEEVFLICREDRVDFVRPGFVPADIADVAVLAPDLSIPAKSAYVDGTFPEWRKILPDGEPRPRTGTYPTGAGYCICIDPEFLAKCSSGPTSPGISFDWNGDGAVLVTNSNPRFIGVVCGINNGDTTATVKARSEQFKLPSAGSTPAIEAA